MSFTQSGMYRNDDDNRASGCTFRPNQAGNWAQVGNSTRDGAAPAPTCDEVNADSTRRRVCARSPPPPQYFLADGGKSCSQACADMSNNACNLGAITSAASSVARCSDVVRSLNMSFTQSGMYRNDDDNRASG